MVDSEGLIRDLLVFFGMFAGAGLGLPLPEELLIVAAGLWTASHDEYGMYRWLMLPVCIVGVVIADVLLYAIGRRFGVRLLDHPWMARIVRPAKRARIERNFHKFGVNILLFGRLLPGIRTPLFLIAGLMRLSVPRFLLADAVGAVLGNSLLYFLAFWFGDQFREVVEQAEGTVGRLRPVLILCAIVGIALYFCYNFWRHPVTTGDPAELPLVGQRVAAHMEGSAHGQPKPSVPPAHGEAGG